MKQIVMRSIPQDDGTFYLDCSDCGPLGVSFEEDVKSWVADHMEGHGINGTQLREEQHG